MKALALVRYGKAETAFETIEKEIPTVGDDDVLIEVEGFGLNFADVMARLGIYQDAPPLPAVLGYEVVGRVARVGKNVTSIKEHERVVALTRFGGYAEFAVAHALACVPIGESVPLVEATALATQFCTAYYMLEKKVEIKAHDRVLIHSAAGGVGTALTQLAKRRGAYVIATVGSTSKRKIPESFGADDVIVSREEDFAQAIRKKFGNQPLDYVFDAVGGETFKKGYRLLKPTGTIVGFGAAESANRGASKLLSGLKLLFGFGIFSPAFLIMKSQAIIGVNLLRVADLRPDLIQDCLLEIVRLYQTGEIHPLSGGEFPAAELAKAHQLLEERKTTGKVAIRFH